MTESRRYWSARGAGRRQTATGFRLRAATVEVIAWQHGAFKQPVTGSYRRHMPLEVVVRAVSLA